MNCTASTRIKVLRLRIKDKHSKFLSELAHDVNFVWNYCNELQVTVFNRERRFLSGYDFSKYTCGATKEGLHLHSQTVEAIAEEYARRRRQCKKVRLRWRKSAGSRRSLGWIPFKRAAIRPAHGQVKFANRWLSLWDTYALGAYKIRAGNFCEDARGRWYLNACVQVSVAARAGRPGAELQVGIDLGLKDLATTSAGQKIVAPQFYRAFEVRLASAQRVGNINSTALAKTSRAKSVFDAGWSAFRTMLRYKCDFAGATFAEVDEAFSTQTCSACGARSGPKGIAGLGIRAWACGQCGTAHDRDVNAAKNILAAGRRRLAEGIPVL